MIEPKVAPDASGIHALYQRLHAQFARRRAAAEVMHTVREGGLRRLFPEELEFSLSFSGVPVANFIDNVAHDMSEGIAPLPALNCVSGKMSTDADLQRAETKNRIGENYWRRSRLEVQMLSGADQYVTYGYVPFYVEPNYARKLPHIHVENPRKAMYRKDRFGDVVAYAYEIERSVDSLCDQFPEYTSQLVTNDDGTRCGGDQLLKVVRWVDKKNVTLFIPNRNMVLVQYAHGLTRCPVVVAERPHEGDNPRGQFDDVVYVQVAKAIMSILALEAAHTAVMAPTAVPSDMDELPIGPHAVLQSDRAGDIHKVNLELPGSVFAEQQNLDNELRVGSRYPDARNGNVQASVITGKGVQALLGSFDSQIKGAQMILKEALESVTELCFEMDETYWPNDSKTVTGTVSGSSYEFNYTPAKAIAGRWTCTVSYGLASGMAPTQASIWLLQLQGAGIISKHTMQSELPMPLDPAQEQRKLDVERYRDAIVAAMAGYTQSAAQVAAQGGDATGIINVGVSVVKQIQDGVAIEDAVAAAFEAETARQQAIQQQAQAQQEAAMAADQSAAGPDAEPTAPNAGGSTLPGATPTLSQLVAGFRGAASTPVLQAQIRRSVPTGVS